jgi:arabinogalactan endo-1,4-beta-galactosidase
MLLKKSNKVTMKTIFKTLFSLSLIFFTISCSDNETTAPPEEPIIEDTFVRAADMSFLPLIESESTIYYNASNQPENALTTLKNAGCNTIRIRLWKNPTVNQSGFNEVKTFAQRVKQAGMKVWLTVHYSDTWADPGAQTTPVAWQSLSFADLKTEAVTYTSSILTEIQPDIFQIGNEINSGLLWPNGHLINNESQSLQLIAAISSKIRTQSPATKIMLHYAGIGSGATWFYNKMSTIDYDYIGLSYYSVWQKFDRFKNHYQFIRFNAQ